MSYECKKKVSNLKLLVKKSNDFSGKVGVRKTSKKYGKKPVALDWRRPLKAAVEDGVVIFGRLKNQH